MSDEELGTVKLMRCPIDTQCGSCKEPLPFGAWAYYDSRSGEGICPECAVKRGWSPKERVKQLIKALELQEDIKALKEQRKIEIDALILLKKQIDLHRLGERDLELETKIIELMNTVDGYLKQCGTPKEKEALGKVFDVIRETQELQKEVRDRVQNRLFVLERKEAAIKKKAQKALA